MTPSNKRMCLYDLATGLAKIIITQHKPGLFANLKSNQMLELGEMAIKNTRIKVSIRTIKYVKMKVEELYTERVEFDMLEALSILFLGLSDIVVQSKDLKYITPIREATLCLIKLYDPRLEEHDKYNVVMDRYEKWIGD